MWSAGRRKSDLPLGQSGRRLGLPFLQGYGRRHEHHALLQIGEVGAAGPLLIGVHVIPCPIPNLPRQASSGAGLDGGGIRLFVCVCSGQEESNPSGWV